MPDTPDMPDSQNDQSLDQQSENVEVSALDPIDIKAQL